MRGNCLVDRATISVDSLGASTVKWTAPDLCLVLSASDSILCTIFEFCGGKSHRQMSLKKHIDLQSQAIHADKKKTPRKVYIL